MQRVISGVWRWWRRRRVSCGCRNQRGVLAALEAREVDSYRRPASIIQHATAAPPPTPHKGLTRALRPATPTRPCRESPRSVFAAGALILFSGTRAGGARYVAGRDVARESAKREWARVARVCACGALAAGARCGLARGVPPPVMQRAATVARTGKSKARGAGAARASVDTAAPAAEPDRRTPLRRRQRTSHHSTHIIVEFSRSPATIRSASLFLLVHCQR